MPLKIEAAFGDATRKDILALDPRNLVPSRKNSRVFPVRKQDIIALAESLLERGQLQNIRVSRFPDTPTGMWEVIAGNTRLAAALYIVNELGKEFKIKCEVVKGSSPEQAYIDNVVENSLRNETSPVDKAEAAFYMVNVLNLSMSEVAKKFGYTEASISQLLKMHELSSEQKRMVHNNVIKQAAAWELFDLTPPERDVVLAIAERSVEKKSGETRITANAVREAKRKLNDAKVEANERAAEAAKVEGKPAPAPIAPVKNPPLRLPQIKNFIKLLSESDFFMPDSAEYAPKVRKFANDLQRWMDGKLRDQTMFDKMLEFGGFEEAPAAKKGKR